jgi:Tfp pilus assembly protein PilN
MKLNLLPTTEKKSRQGKTAIVVAGLIVLASIGAAAALTFIPAAKLVAAKDGIPELEQKVANTDATAKQADTIIATAADVVRNAQLAQAMIDHNDVYPKLYDDIKRYIPPYYRLQSISAVPTGEGTSRVTLTGTLSGYQRYADLMLALMRFKDARTISRQGYVLNDPVVPALDPVDPVGRMRKPGEAPIPNDGLQRLAYFQAQAAAAPSGYLATGNYGGTGTEVRGALPDASIVVITMDVARDLRVPLAADTLRSAGSAAPAGGPAAGFAGPSGPPGMPPGMPGAPGGPGGRPD